MHIGLQKPQMKLQDSSLALCSPLIMLCLVLQTTNAITYNATLRMGQSITTSDTIVSAGGNFELGFFTEHQNSTEYFVGMWFKKIPKDKIVWVANRERPLTDSSSAMLTIYKDGNLAIVVDHGKLVYFITTISSNSSSNIRAELLDSGNFLLLDDMSLEVLWQSFDYPTDTLLPGMNIGFDQVSGYSWSLRSWTSAQDPGPGLFSLEANLTDQLLIIKKGSEIYSIVDKLPEFSAMFENQSRSTWNGLKGFYITWQAEYGSRLVLEVSGELNIQLWNEYAKEWDSVQSTRCGRRGLCGNFGVCNPQAKSPCGCLQGFVPYDPSSWKQGRPSAGCVRRTPLLCSNFSSIGNGFLLVKAVEFPIGNPPQIWRLNTADASTCKTICSSNCSCLAYAYSFKGECLLWHDQVLDLKNVSVDVADDGQQPSFPSFFLKLAASDIENEANTKKSQGYKPKSSGKKAAMIGIFIAFAALFMLGFSVYFVYYNRRNQKGAGKDLLQFDVGMSMKVDNSDHSVADEVAIINKKEVKLPLFSFASVSAATDHFSTQNKLGEGGFGPVYKAKLLNGDEVAIKRLSTKSGQGWEELKNEALLIAKLQHNNLVRLLGCCIERGEKMLIYEFMPNKSLDFILFDPAKSKILDWKTRVRIIYGIAQGLLYLHQFSRFRIIHRDLKASNILLDIDLNPKISDFGMARMFMGNESQANTNRIVGTYGYMSPEYALEGIFSIKSDVFSFGILLLEIITGKKNTGFYNTNSFNLLGYVECGLCLNRVPILFNGRWSESAWDLWTSGRGIQLLDPVLRDASVRQEIVLKYVNIALLCVQEGPADRPNMSDVVSMLGNENAVLAFPKPVAFLNVRGMKNLSSAGNVSANAMTASVIEAR